MSIRSQALLSDRAVIAIAGDDAREFLQGLITNDIYKVAADKALFAAMLTPQGKFLYDFFIIKQDGRLLLETDSKAAADMIKRLNMYRLRSKVEIAALPETKVGAEWGGGVHSAVIQYQDPRLPELGTRIIGNELALEDDGVYEKHRLSLGIPAGGIDLETNGAFPMQWGYDKLNAIDFNKGCYVGQEVTARSKHIGTIRKMVHQVRADALSLPVKGTPVTADEKEVGKMASSAGNIGLALLNIEAVESGAKLLCGGLEIKASLPNWIKSSP